MARIRDEILAAPAQRIPFARFMALALTEPGLGYYATSGQRPTREGDFLTAAELHPFFGRCLGRFLSGAWEALGRPSSFLVREHGAGRGTLGQTVRSGIEADASPLAGALRWEGVDLPPRSDTRTAADGGTAAGDEGGGRRPGRAGHEALPAHVVLANEYLDALPVHAVVQEDGLREVYVTWQQGWFAEVLAEPSTPALAEHLAADGVELAEGQRAEISLAAPGWLADVAAGTGMVLVIDYGHSASELYGPRRMAGSLLTYRRHAVGDDPYAAVGRTDITAHVDVTALQRAAAEAGLVALAATTQARFLTDLGLGQLLGEMGRDGATSMASYLEARSAVARLVDPRHMGAFRVLAWARAESALATAQLPGLTRGA